MNGIPHGTREAPVQDDVTENAAGLARSPPRDPSPRADGRPTRMAERAGDPASQRFQMLSVEGLEALPEASWLVRDFLPKGGLVCIYGAPGSGKSFLALDLCLHVATGGDWNGLAVEQGLVVYAAGEGVHGLWKRVETWKKGQGVELPDSFLVCPEVPNFLGKEGAAFLDALRRLPEKLGLVVIDTLAQAMPGGDENGSSDMGWVVHECGRIARETGATVLLIHHSTKGTKTIRGHSSLAGALDTIIAVSKSGKTVTVKTEKQKDAEAAAPIYLVLEEVRLSPDGQGRPMGSCVLRPRTSQETETGLADGPQKVLKALQAREVRDLGASPKELSDTTGKSLAQVHRDLKDLMGQGLVKKIKRGKYDAISHLS